MTSQSLQTLPDLSMSSLSANICAELAAGLSDAEGIKRRYALSDPEWNRLRKSPVFRGMLKDALRRFSGDLNAGKRIKIKSEIALEDSIPLLHSWAHDQEIAIGNRLDAIKQMSVLAECNGKGQPAAGGSAGPGFSINIVVRGSEKKEVITSSPVLEAADYTSED